MSRDGILRAALDGSRPSPTDARQLVRVDPETLIATAAALRDRGHRNVASYSRKVFIPLTTLCRDVCHYCTMLESVSERLLAPGGAHHGSPDKRPAVRLATTSRHRRTSAPTPTASSSAPG